MKRPSTRTLCGITAAIPVLGLAPFGWQTMESRAAIRPQGAVPVSAIVMVAQPLTARGIDTRGVLLPGSALCDEAIRHGGAYLVELVATAQLADRIHADRTVRGSASGDGSEENTAGRRWWSAS